MIVANILFYGLNAFGDPDSTLTAVETDAIGFEDHNVAIVCILQAYG